MAWLFEENPNIWLRALVGFGGLTLLGVVGFIVAWRDINRARREAQAGRMSRRPSD